MANFKPPEASLAAAAVALLGAAAATATPGRHSGPPEAVADYVIVGGGTAGCVLAARLCETLPHATITLLERGAPRTPADDSLIERPLLAGDAWTRPTLAEVFESEPQLGLLGRTLGIITGATLGGSSSINAGQWTTPGLQQAAGWGFPGFTESTAAAYFAAAARRVTPAVPPPNLQQQLSNVWLDGANASGIPADVDPLRTSAQKSAFATYTPLAGDAQGRRIDAFSAYLEPVMHGACRHNLDLVQAAVVTRVVVEGGRATGVDYLKTDAPAGQRERRVRARREVISAAGPYGSPKLLQLSGIGPAALLATVGVPLVQDLPVGQAVQGRVVTPLLDVYTAIPLAPELNSSVIFSADAAATFDAGEGGVLGISLAGIVGGLPDERCLIGGTGVLGPGFRDTPLLLIYAVPNAVSRGTLAITPATVRDPSTPPAVNLNLLSTPDEVAAVAGCLNRLTAVTDSSRAALGLVNILPGVPLVNATHVQLASNNSYHFAAGCPVGEVVDGGFHVLGVDGLRVVDASVIPQLPDLSGLMATVYALAEHAADLIIAEDARAACSTFFSPALRRLCRDGRWQHARHSGTRMR